MTIVNFTEITYGFFIVTLLLCIGLLYLYSKNRKLECFLHATLFFLCSTIFLFGQFQLGHNLSSVSIIFWSKFRYLGVFGFLYTLPLFGSIIIEIKLRRSVKVCFGILTFLCMGLIIFTNLLIDNQTELWMGITQAAKGVLYPPFIIMLVLVCVYSYIKIMTTSKRKLVPPSIFIPLKIGLGFTIVFGILDVIRILFIRRPVPIIPWPLFIFGLCITSIFFGWTFFSHYSFILNAFTASRIAIKRLIKKSNEDFLEFINLIIKTIDTKDHYTAGHSLQVMIYSINIANALSLSESEIELVKQAAVLHDIGKIGIPNEVLNKKTPLTEKEREFIYRHPVAARNILSTVTDFKDILDIIYYHHERVDGKGYPDGKTKAEIPLLSRIIAVADAYDAMRSERPYRKARTKEEAIEELKKFSGKQFDVEIVKVFIPIL